MSPTWYYEEGKPEERRFDSKEEAQAWLDVNDPAGVAFADSETSAPPEFALVIWPPGSAS